MTLTFDRVTRRFGHHVVLRELDLQAAPGDPIALLGPNGAGKTTVLRLAAGLLRPTKGAVERDGIATIRPEARHGLAYVGQDAPVYPELTVREHMQWWGKMHGVPIDMDGLDDAGLRAVAEDRAATLSRGQRQRLHLAMAFALEPTLLLLDEPTTALDGDGRAWLTETLLASPAAMLIATHEDHFAAALGARPLRLGDPS